MGCWHPSLLSQFDVDLDFGQGVVKLFDPNHCPGTIDYWAPTYASAPFVLDGDGHILVGMTLDGVPVHAAIDTGAPVSAMSIPFAKKTFGIEPGSPGTERLGSLADKDNPDQAIYGHTFKSLMVDGLEVKNLPVALYPDNLAQANGYGSLPDLILGLRELHRLHLYIAYKEATLYFTAAGAQYPDTDEGRSCLRELTAKAKAKAAAENSHDVLIAPSDLAACPK
jgi:hypothetical protein